MLQVGVGPILFVAEPTKPFATNQNGIDELLHLCGVIVVYLGSKAAGSKSSGEDAS